MNNSKPSKLAKMQVFVSLGVPVILIVGLFIGVEIYHAGPGYRKLKSHRYLGQCFKVTEMKALHYRQDRYQSKVLNDALDVKDIDRNFWYDDWSEESSPFTLLAGDLLRVDTMVKLDVIDPVDHSKYVFMHRLDPGEHCRFYFCGNGRLWERSFPLFRPPSQNGARSVSFDAERKIT